VLAPNPLFGGMSGVLYGLSGYAWMKGRFAPELGIFLDPTLIFMMLAWFVFCLLGVIGSVANVAHGVGLLMGIAIGIAPHVFRRRSI
jgi:GlpG protein